MNKKSTSTSEIMDVCKQLVVEKGLHELNMRDVAARCNVALGSLYNYYPSKNDLLIATIGSIWQEIMEGFDREGSDFEKKVEELYSLIKNGSDRYPNFFNLHALGLSKNNKDKGRIAMDRYFGYIKNVLVYSLRNDPNINKEFFTQSMSDEMFVEFVFDNIINLLLRKFDDCTPLLYIVRKCIY
ncbi:MAG: TetR/AcrR family transcriptional regulator [Erysipelotrichaceae bacterium]|nr:TetR/AcrR family transcriptional regulator [Erysipelotrichaceae bacterium]